MKSHPSSRFWAPFLVLGAILLSPGAAQIEAQSAAQAVPSVPQSLLDKAHALEIRGRLDMAQQAWQQVLLADPNNKEALGGLARAYKLAGNLPVAQLYIDRLKAIDPNDPGIARAESAQVQQDHAVQLQQAGKLAQAGQYAQAMNVYRQVYGEIPPPGDPALAYYETEAATEEGRPHAIAGLRHLSEEFPGDARYQVALGKILTYNPKTREEGRNYLKKFPDDPQAVEGLRQSLVWDAQNPASAKDIRDYLAHHQDQQLSTILRNQPKTVAGTARPLTAEEKAAQAAVRARSAEEQAAYKALNAKHLDDAEQRFKAILAEHPEAPNALAGMGYIRMQQANFGGAISFLVQAKQDGAKDPGLDNAILTSRFWYTMSQGASALNDNDLPNAEKLYRTALGIRPTSPEALQALGGTLLKAQQADAAIPVFEQYVKLKPADPAAWRGLFSAQDLAGRVPQALQTDKRTPAAVHAKLLKDPDYLRVLASAYAAAGRDADAQRVLRVALDLPFPADAQGLQAETQMQYASLLQQANHLDQAAGLYRQVLAKDQKNVSAWQGLVRVEHAMTQDQQAVQTIESMPPETYDAAMRDPGFETTVASIYQVQGKLDVAQDLLEKAIAAQTTAGQKPSVPIQLQLAGIYLERNNPQQAYPIYQQVLSENPDRLDAWKGLLNALHSTGHDQEALAQIQQIPVAVRAQLESDVDYLQVAGAVYNALGQPQQSTIFLNRVKQHYAAQNATPPADVDIQNAWLLYNGGNDAGLYRQLMTIGGRVDLTSAQRLTVQTIWANWAVRRANQAAAAGNDRRSLAILNAAAKAFPDNPGVIKALAGGYARAGLAKQAIVIWKAQNMTSAPASDYKAAVGAALAADDLKDAETWLRFGLDQYPKDAEMLALGAKFEAARGDTNRAAVYYRASLDAMPPDDPGAELANELSHPMPAAATTIPGPRQAQDLSTLLKPGTDDTGMAVPAAPSQPYLPSYGNVSGQAPVTIPGNSVVPSYMANPSATPQTAPAPRTRLKDYVPQASADLPVPMDGTEAPPVEVASNDSFSTEGSSLVYSPTLYQQQQVAQATAQIAPQDQSTQPAQQQPLQRSGRITATPQEPSSGMVPPPQTSSDDQFGPYIPYHAPASMAADQNPGPTTVQLGQTPQRVPLVQPEVTDVLPTARYVPNARVKVPASSHPDIAAANAAAIRRRQSNPDALTGVSHPPADDYNSAPTQNTQFNPSAQTTGQTNSQTQVTQPRRGSLPATSPTGAAPVQTGDSNGQQYPQPGTTAQPSSSSVPRLRARRATSSDNTQTQTTQAPSGAPLSYPSVAQPLGSQPYPLPGSPYPLGQAPTDADLAAKRVPPLRGGYSDSVLAPAAPLTARQQTERDLATLEASYSGWIGGTASARYRSGTAGIDRLTDLEAPVEASVVVNNSIRFSIIPRAVFLSSGTLDTTGYTSSLPINAPELGTFNASQGASPAQQFASGVGGEIQMVTRNFAASIGYTPYDFLVENVLGHMLFKPTQHFTLSFDRDSVVETQLSYAGLRDPGRAGPSSPGPIWGGVVSTGGGARFDFGDEKAGFYITADGADLSGYHVLENYKFEGSAGAYFLAHTWPHYGKLNIGASLFGMHYQFNERGETYGLGGYFSPSAYFLAAIPVTYTGNYKDNFHYSIAGSIGVQTFQEASQIFFPLDPGVQTTFDASANGTTTNGTQVTGNPCTPAQITASTCGASPVNTNTGFNYSINSEGSYRVNEHWYVGGFLSGNNTNNYNTVSGGFFVRYLFRPQYPTESSPTGMFPVSGFRPLRVP